MNSDPGARIRALVDRRGEVTNAAVVRALGVSSATAHRLLRALVVSGVLELHGRGPASRYRLRPVRFRFARRGLEENEAWSKLAAAIERVRPLAEQERRSLQYGASEVINNAVDHSRGRRVETSVDFGERGATVLTVRDDGVGVFRRICEDFGIPSAKEAIVHLEKGKLTSDPARHSGEGLFFTSKAVTRFRLESQGLAWIVDNEVGDRGIGPSTIRKGTRVTLEAVAGKTPRLVDVFRAYTDPAGLRFTRTRATVKLAASGKSLMSRSEARRLLEGLTKFTQATLDFSGVEVVGQGFCDEVFRVFARAHPEVRLEPIGMSEEVAFMVARARAS